MKRKRNDNENSTEELERSARDLLLIQERKERDDKACQEYEEGEKYSALYTEMQRIKNTDSSSQLNIDDLPSPNQEMSSEEQKWVYRKTIKDDLKAKETCESEEVRDQCNDAIEKAKEFIEKLEKVETEKKEKSSLLDDYASLDEQPFDFFDLD